jgi:hypothetical protein
MSVMRRVHTLDLVETLLLATAHLFSTCAAVLSAGKARLKSR